MEKIERIKRVKRTEKVNDQEGTSDKNICGDESGLGEGVVVPNPSPQNGSISEHTEFPKESSLYKDSDSIFSNKERKSLSLVESKTVSKESTMMEQSTQSFEIGLRSLSKETKESFHKSKKADGVQIVRQGNFVFSIPSKKIPLVIKSRPQTKVERYKDKGYLDGDGDNSTFFSNTSKKDELSVHSFDTSKHALSLSANQTDIKLGQSMSTTTVKSNKLSLTDQLELNSVGDQKSPKRGRDSINRKNNGAYDQFKRSSRLNAPPRPSNKYLNMFAETDACDADEGDSDSSVNSSEYESALSTARSDYSTSSYGSSEYNSRLNSARSDYSTSSYGSSEYDSNVSSRRSSFDERERHNDLIDESKKVNEKRRFLPEISKR